MTASQRVKGAGAVYSRAISECVSDADLSTGKFPAYPVVRSQRQVRRNRDVRLGGQHWRGFRRFGRFRSGQGEPLRDGFPLVALGLHILVHRAQVGQALFGQVRPRT